MLELLERLIKSVSLRRLKRTNDNPNRIEVSTSTKKHSHIR